MAFLTNQKWYVGSTKWTAVTAWAASTVYSAGQLRRQLAAPAVASERVFVCIAPGTSGGSEPTWVITQGAKTTDNTVTWMEVTGKAGVNGDLTNTSTWGAAKAITTTPSLGVIVQRASAASLQICTTSGTVGASEPAFSDTAGVTTIDSGATWTSLGAPSGYSAWGAAAARLAITLAASPFALGTDTTYVSNNHAETQASSIAYNVGVGVASTIQNIICVSDAAAPPTALATTATVSATGASNIIVGNYIYVYGVGFIAGSAANNALIEIENTSVNTPAVFESCGFTLNTTSITTTGIYCGSNTTFGGYVKLSNCTFVFGATGQSLHNGSRTTIRNANVAQTGSVPTNLLTASGAGVCTIEDTDLSQITGTILSLGANTLNVCDYNFNNCKLNGSVALTSGNQLNILGPTVRFANCDSATTNYRYYLNKATGTAQSETTVVRSGGASDGTTPLSWNLQTTTQACYGIPFSTDEIAQWNNLTGSSHTASVYITSNTALTNALCWLELEYASSSSAPLGATVSSRVALLATPVALTSDSSTWGGSITNKYILSVTFTPQAKGPVKATIKVAAPSVTVYVDPLITIV